MGKHKRKANIRKLAKNILAKQLVNEKQTARLQAQETIFDTDSADESYQEQSSDSSVSDEQEVVDVENPFIVADPPEDLKKTPSVPLEGAPVGIPSNSDDKDILHILSKLIGEDSFDTKVFFIDSDAMLPILLTAGNYERVRCYGVFSDRGDAQSVDKTLKWALTDGLLSPSQYTRCNISKRDISVIQHLEEITNPCKVRIFFNWHAVNASQKKALFTLALDADPYARFCILWDRKVSVATFKQALDGLSLRGPAKIERVNIRDAKGKKMSVFLLEV